MTEALNYCKFSNSRKDYRVKREGKNVKKIKEDMLKEWKVRSVK
jgi:hypothetical protein